MSDFRRSRTELRNLIEESQRELEIIDLLPLDTYEVDTYLEFTQGEDRWLAMKTRQTDEDDNNLWWNYAGQALVSWEQLFPFNTDNLEIRALVPTLVWENKVTEDSMPKAGLSVTFDDTE